MMQNAGVVLTYAIMAVFFSLLFRRYPDHSWYAVTDWVLLYLAGLVLPVWWEHRALRHFRTLGIPITKPLRSIAFYPIVAAGVVLLTALNLIRVASIR